MLFSLILPPVIATCGIFFTVRLFKPIVMHPKRTLRAAVRGSGMRESLGSLCLALSGTLGVGNIVGVAAGIAAGGAGSVFWMLTSALFSAVIKYAEGTLAAADGHGLGLIPCVKRAFGKKGAALYAALSVLLALTMGSALQSGAVRGAAEGIGANMHIATPIVTALVISAVIFGGRGIRRAVSLIIPFATVCYSLLCLAVIIPNLHLLRDTLSEIVTDALTPRAASGGVLGFIISSGMREGFARGLLSNEAGAGTSAFSHTEAAAKNPIRCGLFGATEVIFDTVILCMETAVMILISGTESQHGVPAIAKTLAKYTAGAGNSVLFVCISLFATATVLCWYCYGKLAACFFHCFLLYSQ